MVQSGQTRVLFDVKKDGDKMAPKWVAPEEEQEQYESRRYIIYILLLFMNPTDIRLR
jgi:hypothetical protein